MPILLLNHGFKERMFARIASMLLFHTTFMFLALHCPGRCYQYALTTHACAYFALSSTSSSKVSGVMELWPIRIMVFLGMLAYQMQYGPCMSIARKPCAYELHLFGCLVTGTVVWILDLMQRAIMSMWQ